MQGEFVVKKYYEIILDHFSTELGRRGGHELLTLLAAHASKRMDGSTIMSRKDLPVRWQPRDSPISSNSTGYSPSTSAPAFENFRIHAGDSCVGFAHDIPRAYSLWHGGDVGNSGSAVPKLTDELVQP
jgi:hypothetical protein